MRNNTKPNDTVHPENPLSTTVAVVDDEPIRDIITEAVEVVEETANFFEVTLDDIIKAHLAKIEEAKKVASEATETIVGNSYVVNLLNTWNQQGVRVYVPESGLPASDTENLNATVLPK